MVDPKPIPHIPLWSMINRRMRALGDHWTLSRYLGHLALLLLMLAALWSTSPRDLRSPTAMSLSSLQSTQTDTVDARFSNTSNSDTHYLEQSVVPFTTRALRDVLPFSAPELTVRTEIATYVVQSGDSLLAIASKFGLQDTTLVYSNDALAEDPDYLKVGQVLNILPVDGALHTVVAGDTVTSVAEKYSVDPSAITSFAGNHLVAPYDLTAGQQLIVPGGVKKITPKTIEVSAYTTASAPVGAEQGSGQFVWPTSGYISQYFTSYHHAIDIATSRGTPVVAADAGYVSVAGWSSVGYGNMIIIDHGNGIQTLYAHLSAFNVQAGQSVSKGELIGAVGDTGNATGPHLHFEVIVGGARYNPLSYLPN